MKSLFTFTLLIMVLCCCNSYTTQTAMQDKLAGKWKHIDTLLLLGDKQVSIINYSFMPDGKGMYSEDVHSLNNADGNDYFIISEMQFDWNVQEINKGKWLCASYRDAKVIQSQNAPFNKEEYIKANNGKTDTTAVEITPGDTLVLYNGEEKVYFTRQQ